MSMTDAMKVFSKAKKLCFKITDMAIKGSAAPGEYSASVDIVRDAILTLAQLGEFGLVAELATQATDLLDQNHMPSSYSEHCLSYEDFIYHIQTLPTSPSGLVNHISSVHKTNGLIVDSVLKSRSVHKIELSVYVYKMMCKLAKERDIENWNKVATALLEHTFNVETVLRSFSHFDKELIEARPDQFVHLKINLIDYRPNSFLEESNLQSIKELDLLDNLFAINEKELIQHMATASYRFTTPFKIHEYISRYNFEPSIEYLESLEKMSGPTSHKNFTTLNTSLFTYLLSKDSKEINYSKALQPEQLKEILALDGTEHCHGIIILNQKKIGKLLDSTFLISVAANRSWERVEAEYANIPKNILMLSNYYRGRQLSDALGM
jgi:hypothetical protein